MRNDKKLRQEIDDLLYDHTNTNTPDVIEKLVAIVHEERKAALDDAKFDRAMMDAEKESFEEHKRHIQAMLDQVHRITGPALDELNTLDYRNLKEKTLLKSDVMREYFRVMESIIPPAHDA